MYFCTSEYFSTFVVFFFLRNHASIFVKLKANSQERKDAIMCPNGQNSANAL